VCSSDLTGQAETLQTALADPELFTKDHARFEKLALELAKVQTALATAEEQWLNIEIKRENLEGA